MKIVYSFGANVAFIMALLFTTAWAACNTRVLAVVRLQAPKAQMKVSVPTPAASPAGHTLVTFRNIPATDC